MRRRNRCFYHYTDLEHLKGILYAGAVLSYRNPTSPDPHGLPPLVWFSCASPWEPISKSTLILAPDNWAKLPRGIVPGPRFGAVRIRVPFEVTEPWDRSLSKHGTHWSVLMRLAQTGYDYQSDPEEWRVCESPVPADTWLTIELWNGSYWQCLPRNGVVYNIADLDAFMAPHKIGTVA